MLKRVRRMTAQIFSNRFFSLLIAGALFFFLYIFRLGSLTPGMSSGEVSAAIGSESLRAIFHDPLYAPHKLVQLALRSGFSTSPTSLRLASVMFAGIFLICFYALSARWFGRLIAATATMLLAATPWVALLGRNAAPSIMLMAPSAVVLTYYWLSRSQKRLRPIWLLFSFCAAASLYIPGMLWVLLAGLIINRRSLIFNLKRLNLIWLAAGGALFAALVAPLVWALGVKPSLLHEWVLWPTSLAKATALAKTAGWTATSLFAYTHQHVAWLVGHLPVLSIMVTALTIFGTYAMSQQARQKLYLIISMVVFGWLAASLNDNLVYLTFCLVPLLILAAAGLRFLYLQWQSVFPRNPLPRYLAYGLILTLAVVQVIYGLRATLYAWPNTSDTKSTFVLK